MDLQDKLFKTFKKVRNPDKVCSKDGSLLNGYVGDGWGNIYVIPKSGYSPVFKFNNKKFRYNYDKNSLEWIDKSDKTNEIEVIYSLGLSPSNWADGPEYWRERMCDEINSSY